MGKKSGNSWFSEVKKAFRSPTNDERKRDVRREENEDDKRWIFRRHNFPLETTIQHSAAKICSEEENMVRKQAIFRGYPARRVLLALKGVVNLQALIRVHNVRKRAKMTLQCIQSLVRVQALVCNQRRRLSCKAKSLGSMFRLDDSGRKSSLRNASKCMNNVVVNPTDQI